MFRFIERARLITALITLVIIGFQFAPLQTTIVVGSLMGLYLFLVKFFPQIRANQTEDNTRTMLRESSLWTAKAFLAPYKSIWKNLKLSNTYCSLQLGNDGITITCKEKRAPFRCFKVVQSNVHTYETLWNMFCRSFNFNTHYEGIVEDCDRYNVIIKEWQAMPTHTETQPKLTLSEEQKTDINNASESELTALPGISVIMAKKLIKKREEIGGFKSIEEVFIFLRLTENLQNQLKNSICVKDMQGYTKIERTQERNVDL